MMNEKQQLSKARKLIKNRQYAKARKILVRLEHPTAYRWLAKLDDTKLKIAKNKTSNRTPSPNRPSRVFVIFALILTVTFIIGLMLIIVLITEDTNSNIHPLARPGMTDNANIIDTATADAATIIFATQTAIKTETP
jgi:hypothetical protein